MSARVEESELTRSETRVIRALAGFRMSRPLLVNLAIVAGMILAHLMALYFTPPSSGPWAWPLLVSGPALTTLLLRRRYPWVGLAATLIATVLLIVPDIHIGALNLGILVAVYSVASRSSATATVGAGLLAMLYPVARLIVFEWPFGEGMMLLIGEAVETIVVAGFGWSIHLARQRTSQLRHTVTLLGDARSQLATDAAAIERARIARDFHDILSHHLAVVVVRASGARTHVGRRPGRARDTLVELERTSRSALGEMRQLLGAMREGRGEVTEADPTPGATEEQQRRPAPTLERLDALVDSVRGSGMVWQIERHGHVRELGQGVEMTAYRIVQEAVTNVLKHAGFGRARVVLDYGENTLGIEVTNKVGGLDRELLSERRPAPRETSTHGSRPAGHGLIGLRERVAVLGGTLAAHPVPHGFHLTAVLPCTTESR